MKSLHAAAAALAAAALLGAPAAPAAAQISQYHVVKTLNLGKTRADYLLLDDASRRLYGLGDNVIDVDRDTIVGHVEGSGGGFAVAGEFNRGLVRNGVVFDMKTLKVTDHLEGVRGDGIRYDPATKKAFTWADDKAWEVDMKTGKLLGATPIGDGLESGVADGRGHMYLNVEDSGFVEQLDTRSYKIGPVFKVANCGHAQGLSMDTQSRRLFMACDTNVMVLNADNGDVVARIGVPSRADMNCFDPVAKLAFNPNRVDSTLTVIHEDSPAKFTVTEKAPMGGAARTCAVDSKTHKVYVFYYNGTTRQNAELVMAVLAP